MIAPYALLEKDTTLDIDFVGRNYINEYKYRTSYSVYPIIIIITHI
jgi:hypothetical protein